MIRVGRLHRGLFSKLDRPVIMAVIHEKGLLRIVKNISISSTVELF